MILKFKKFWIASLHCVTLAMTHCICSSRHCELRGVARNETKQEAIQKNLKNHMYFFSIYHIFDFCFKSSSMR